MPRRFRYLVAAILFGLVCAAAASISLWSPVYSLTEDRNGDGRPDVWRTYDRQGRLSEVAIDTNFDGRSDVHEYYAGGALTIRESDRNFDDRVDLVQRFDSVSHEQERTVEDVDYDGTADVLTLFQGGHAVFSKWAHPSAPAVAIEVSLRTLTGAPRTADDPLAPFDDPFRTDVAMGAVRLLADSSDCVGSATSGWLPTPDLEVTDRLASASTVELADHRHLPSAILDPHSSRGPPVSHS